ncbi:SDR family oxidoreductase [Microvirga brassicacearum]|uniref:SDR family oxidoreductase n=1 Tax=Microvirga brassicacearum TaxID=2580413 RepID=A0A5N3PEE6_9HYPH|nr:SDR family NAD(P)-dependent oxidoreductase [Microvirga brassicacearum]KAB0268070.1 SDR family oxidoreductase [Microvirga brassicacearum]
MTLRENSYDLAGRLAVITGGAGQIGSAIAKIFSRSGAKVEIWDRHEPAAAEGVLRFRAVDVTDPGSVSRAMAEAARDLGGVDLLVNAAGVTGPTKNVADYSPAEWQLTLSVNLTSVFYCSHAALQVMDRSRSGRIINIASVAGKDGNPGMAAYSAAKAGVIAFSKALGKELGTTQIRVHSIAPALIETGLLRQMDPEMVAANFAKIPMGRAGTPKEVAELAAWLASDGCSFSTGAVHDLSGGRATY